MSDCIIPPSFWLEKEMTHLEKFVALYKEFGIDCKIQNVACEGSPMKHSIILSHPNDTRGIEATEDARFDGLTEVFFDEDGNFMCQDFWD